MSVSEASTQLAAADSASRDDRTSLVHSAAIVLIVALLGAIGIVLKAPFGRHLMHLAGYESSRPRPETWYQWLLGTEWGWLILITAACLLLYPYSGLRAAPLIDRLVFRNEVLPKRKTFLPGLIAALVLTALFSAGLFFSDVPPIAKNLVSGHFSEADTTRMAYLWPLGFAGAGLSEEVLYRFGLITPVLGLAGLLFGRDRPRVAAMAFWTANIAQAALFGFGHVAQGVVASAAGGMLLATALAPQTWGGLLFGYVYRRWGIEAAIISHMLTDIFVPALILVWAYAHL